MSNRPYKTRLNLPPKRKPYKTSREFPPGTPWQTRFWAWTDKNGPNGCWIWTAYKTPRGYGQLNKEVAAGGKMYMTHRLSYEMHKGPIPPGMVVDHLCRTLACVNPDHLELVTQRENLMRGVGQLAAINAAKTHCDRGHPFDAENTRWIKGGRYRECKACKRIRAAKSRAKRKGLTHSVY